MAQFKLSLSILATLCCTSYVLCITRQCPSHPCYASHEESSLQAPLIPQNLNTGHWISDGSCRIRLHHLPGTNYSPVADLVSCFSYDHPFWARSSCSEREGTECTFQTTDIGAVHEEVGAVHKQERYNIDPSRR